MAGFHTEPKESSCHHWRERGSHSAVVQNIPERRGQHDGEGYCLYPWRARHSARPDDQSLENPGPKPLGKETGEGRPNAKPESADPVPRGSYLTWPAGQHGSSWEGSCWHTEVDGNYAHVDMLTPRRRTNVTVAADQ